MMKGEAPKLRLVLIGTGSLFASMVLGGFLLGYWVDVWLDASPLFMIGFGLLGLIGGILKAYRLLI